MDDLPKQYDPQDAQQKWYTYWEEHGYFNADPHPDKPSHTIMIPLPNVTGALHMGHALNGTLQDLITRRRRMQGYEALWMPGTDHAGIATQAVVERRMLEEEGLTRHDIGREALVNRIWKWKDTYEERILSQLKSLGASCDWRRTRFTLDDVCEKAVRRTFFKLFKDGLIYRGKRLVNWDAHLQTAVADDEVFSEDINGHFWTFHYHVVDDDGNETDEQISFATTRPETMLGDTAVCVYPGDERYEHLVGKKVRIPLNGRDIPIIADPLLADKEKGTGAVKVTPAHDPNDYACYTRHLGKDDEIGIINLLNPDGTFNENAGQYEGMDRYTVRDKVVEELSEAGYFEKIEDRVVPIKHSDRSKTPVEPYLSDQWFVKMDDLAQNAIDAVEDGRVKFYPGRYAKTYLDWLGEKRDWCISRQLWWGHRIPVWTKEVFTHSQLVSYEAAICGHSLYRAGELAYSIEREPNAKTSTGAPIYARIFVSLMNEDADVIDKLEGAGYLPSDTPKFTNHPDGGGKYTVEFDDAHTTEFYREFLRSLSNTSGGKLRFDVEYIERSTAVDKVNKPFAKIQVELHDSDSEQTLSTLRSMGIDQFEPRMIELEPDVLDTWFSSALWPHETLGWPDLDHDPPLATPSSTPASTQADASGVQDSEAVGLGSEGGNTVLPYFYPGDKSVLVTSRDIITLWVARMVLTGLYNMGDIPFHHVHVHPKILDGFGQTMSKSKGNGVDPVDLIGKYGTDAVRFTIASFAGETQDVRLPINYECPHCEELIDPKLYELDTITVVVPSTLKGEFPIPQGEPKPTLVCPKCKEESQFPTPLYDLDPDASVARMVSERFEYGRNFCNKFWNAARFAMLNLEGYTPGTLPTVARLSESGELDSQSRATELDESKLRLEDRWILSRLSSTVHEVDEYLERYQFDGATRALRDFTWNEFCDWYLEMIKPRLRDDEQKPQVQRVLVGVLDTLLRLLAPFTPFIAEELWQRLSELCPSRGLLEPSEAEESSMIATWPSVPKEWQDRALEARFGRLQETVVAIRNVRAVYNIPPSTPMKLYMKCNEQVASDLNDVSAQFENLSRIILEAAGADIERPTGSASFTLDDADGYIPLEGIIDRDAELARQEKERDKLQKLIKGTEGKLNNENFVNKAPQEVVAQARDTLAGYKKQLESVEDIIRQLS